MKQGAKLLVCLAGGLGYCAATNGLADTQATGPYDEIIARNAFALKPLPPPPSPEETKQPPVKITLTGITTIIGKRALMETPGPAPKPGQAAAPKLFYMLSEGEKQGDIEVLRIDEKVGSVRLINAGQELTLTFDKDGAKLPSTPVPAGLGAPGMLPGVPPPAGFAPPVKTAGAAAPTPGFPSFPQRQVRTGNESTPTGPGFGGVNPAYNSGGVTMPSFASATPLQTQPGLHETGMTPEEQAIVMESQRLQTERQVATGKLPPIPPTPLTPPGSPGSLPRPGLPPLPGMPGAPGS